MKKTVFIVMLITLLSKIFGFARDIVLANFYGTSYVSDAFFISLTIPTVIFAFIGAGISTAYIPMYNKIKLDYGEIEANTYTSNLVNIILLVSSVIVLFGELFTKQIVLVFASGFSGEALALSVQFTKIALVGVYFTGLIYIFQGFIQIKGKYSVSTLVGIPLNLIVLISIVLSCTTNYLVLAIGSVIAIASQLIFILPSVYKSGYRYKFFINFKDDLIIKMIRISIPVIIGVSVNQINVLIDRTLASKISIGGISSLNYANRLNGFVVSIFVLSIATVLYPQISQMAVEKNITGFKKSIVESINSISIILMPATIGSMVFSEPLVRLLFGRGAFDINAINMTSKALFFYSFGMIGYSYREIISRGFYSLQDTKTPMLNATISMVINIILNIILSKFMGISGLALATSISAIFTALLLFISLRKKIGPFGMKKISISFLKILFASLVIVLLAKLIFNYLTLSLSQNLSLIFATGVGAVSYFVMIYFMKIEDVDVIVGAIKKKLGKA